MFDKNISSGRSDADLDELLNDSSLAKQSEQKEFVPQIRIRAKQKDESMRPLGSRVPTYMIEELKLLADYHNTNVEDMVAGILESVLEESMDAVYEHKARQLRSRRKNRSN